MEIFKDKMQVKLALLFLPLAMVLTSCVPEMEVQEVELEQTLSEVEPQANKQEVSNISAKTLYEDNCISCHKSDANGVPALVLKSKKEIIAAIYNNVGGMSFLKEKLSLEQISMIETYLASFKVADPIAVVEPVKGPVIVPQPEITPSSIILKAMNIGQNVLNANVSEANGEFSLSTISGDIWEFQDSMLYVYASFTGDGIIEAKFNSFVGSLEWSKTGVMIREDLEANSPHAFLAMANTDKLRPTFRTVRGQRTDSVVPDGFTGQRYLRLERKGSEFIYSMSSDGVIWTQIYTKTLAMKAQVYAGLALSASIVGNAVASSLSEVKINGANAVFDSTNVVTPVPAPAPTPAPAPVVSCDLLTGDINKGQDLVNNKCLNCHGLKKGFSCEETKKSFTDIPAMGYLQTLSDQDIANIAAYYASLTQKEPLPVIGEKSVVSRVPVANRKVLYSKFDYIFNSPTKDAKITTAITIFKKKGSVFGSTCVPFIERCSDEVNGKELADAPAKSLVKMIPSANVQGRGYMTRICSEVLDVDQAVINVLSKTAITVSNGISGPRIDQLVAVFYPGKTLDQQTYDGLVEIFNAAKSQGMSNTDAWRFVLYSMCFAPQMEIL